MYLQVLEELAGAGPPWRWRSACTALSCNPLLSFGTDEQTALAARHALRRPDRRLQPLSEPQAGSDAAALRCAAVPSGDGYVVNGSKSWITRRRADLQPVRPHWRGPRGLLFSDPRRPARPELRPEGRRWASPPCRPLRRSTTTPWSAPAAHRRRGPGAANRVQRAGRRFLGIAAVAVGIAQAALDEACAYALTSERPSAARSSTTRAGLPAGRHGRRGDRGPRHLSRRRPAPRRRATVFAARQCRQAGRHRCGHEGHHRRGPGARRGRLHPRLPRRALYARGQITQIYEGTNQIQRLVIARGLTNT